MGIGVPGTGIEMNAHAAVRAAKRAVNTMALVVLLCMQFTIISIRGRLDNLPLMPFSYIHGQQGIEEGTDTQTAEGDMRDGIVRQGFQGMTDSTERAALANDLFGRSGQ